MALIQLHRKIDNQAFFISANDVVCIESRCEKKPEVSGALVWLKSGIPTGTEKRLLREVTESACAVRTLVDTELLKGKP